MRIAFLRRQLTPLLWLDLAAAASAVVLLAVHALQRYGGYVPCELCLKEREVFWIALGVALAARALSARAPAAAAAGCAALAVVFVVGAGLGAYHAGVEWRWWPGPASCTGAQRLGSLARIDLMAAISRPVRIAPCDQAALRIVGVSLAGWDAILCAAMALLSVSAPGFAPRRRARGAFA